MGENSAVLAILLNLVADSFPYARYLLEICLILHPLFQGEGELTYGTGSPLIGTNFEYGVPLHFQKG